MWLSRPMRLMPLFLIIFALVLGGSLTILHWSDISSLRKFVFTIFFAFLGLLTFFGLYDVSQRRHTLWYNFPILARMRWIGESLRPFLRSYIVESETEGKPFNHEVRAMAYRRSKNVRSVEPFGSHVEIHEPPYEWLSHSLHPLEHSEQGEPRIIIGEGNCEKPYSASVLNISGMSFGALGGAAVSALNQGAAKGDFLQNTGEGGISKYHKQGGDLCWQLASGYFGARRADGRLDEEKFVERASDDAVKMIEIKLSQGAKPGHGGVLPGPKVTAEIAEARGIPMGETCFSPARHPEFSTPLELCEFIGKLRKLSGGKPVGIKLCVGMPSEVFALGKAFLETRIVPDFIVVDGAEGGTGAAPPEFLDHIGMPLRSGLILMRNMLVGTRLDMQIKLCVSGKLISGFDMAAAFALGADFINCGRGFMFSLGCIQSLHCHTNHCPTGIATTKESLQSGLDVTLKSERVYHFHKNTISAMMEVIGAAGCIHPKDMRPNHIMHRVTADVARPADKAFTLIQPGRLLDMPASTPYARDWHTARADKFGI